jgi:hypothetical protein
MRIPQMTRRGVAVAATAVVVSLAGASGASAADDPQRTFRIQSISAELKFDPISNLTSLVDVRELTGLVDPAGRAVGSLLTKPITLPVALRASPVGEFSCVQNATSKDFVAYRPTEIFVEDAHSVQQDQFHLYRKEHARRLRNVEARSTQYEMCATGGAQPKDARAVQIGLGMSFPDTAQTFKIGQSWKEGQTPANYTSTLGFQLGPIEKVPLQISASISQNPSDKLMGSITGPFATPDDVFARNAVNAWWQDSCKDTWHGCHMKWNGTKDFHGTVAQGLWEFAPDELRGVDHFEVRSYIKY